MSNRQFLLLVGGALILLSIGAALIWNVMTTLNAYESAPKPAQYTAWTGKAPMITLEEAEQQATRRALEWAADARLIKAAASWQPMPEDIKLEMPPVAWALTYYSPSKAAVTTAHVHAESFSWGKSRQMGVDAAALAPFPPSQGLRVAWLSFRAAGGEDFLSNHPGAAVQFSLRNREALVWTVLAFTKDAKFKVNVDAQTGRVLSQE
jgi:hypothetical protein